jgi:NAD(P)-dependent dehydrogenase (short-subunit alcohol dehydrogenase family)
VTSVSVITGAAGAMGTACAHALASTVDVLLLTDVDTATTPSIPNACVVAGDLIDPQFPVELAARARELGTLHSLVQTAGLSPSMAGWRGILSVDLVAVARVLDAFLPQVTDGSAAVCVASIAGHLGAFDPGMDAVLDDPLAPDLHDRFAKREGDTPDPGATYRLAKRAVMRLCERAAVPWGGRGGRVVSLSPGLIDTEMGRLELVHNPIKTWMAEHTPVRTRAVDTESPLPGRVDDIAAAVTFLCSERASFLSGCDVRVDGGLVAAMNQPQ